MGAAVVAIVGAAIVGQSREFRGSSGFSHEALSSIGTPGVVLLVLATTPLVMWRRAPLGVFVLTAVAASLGAALGSPASVPVGATAALYFLAASRSGERPWTMSITAVVVGLFGAHVVATLIGDVGSPGISASHAGLAWIAAWFAGERSRLRGEHLDELRERASRAERDAERDRLLAVAEERVRIARDLHDSAGHAVNVIAVQAGAARLRHPREPERAATVFGEIEQLARDTVEEIDHIVAGLREPGSGPTATTPPGLASLPTLISRHAAAGLDTCLATKGSPRTLSPAADNAAYRILQEALANASRHGTGTAHVEVGFGGSALEVTVANPTRNGGSPRHGGHGIVGMRERAGNVGGTIVAERSEEEFLLHATIPYGDRCE